jgi:hypothetical protein
MKIFHSRGVDDGIWPRLMALLSKLAYTYFSLGALQEVGTTMCPPQDKKIKVSCTFSYIVCLHYVSTNQRIKAK